MNEREVAELRRRLKPDKCGVTHVRGCYVNESGNIVSQFDQSLAMMTQEEGEKFLALLRKTLSGGLGKNLMDLTFDTYQVVHGEEHRLLMNLRSTGLQDEEGVQTLLERIIGSLTIEGSYLILLASDSYDVPYRSGDGERQDDASSEVFTYILCSVCPVRQLKPALSYYIQENEFHDRKTDFVVSPPETGFLFPAFDQRSANIYNALYYTRDIRESRPEFVDAVFRCQPPMAAAQQRECFQSILSQSLEEECSYDTVQAVQDLSLIHI